MLIFKRNELWVTDGTIAGTKQLTTLGIPGAFGDYTLADFTVVGNYALFEGNDASGHSQLWRTDGTLAGTAELNIRNANSGGLQPFEISALAAQLGQSMASFGADTAGNGITFTASLPPEHHSSLAGPALPASL
jgi:ELWxxDGT repeat protein